MVSKKKSILTDGGREDDTYKQRYRSRVEEVENLKTKATILVLFLVGIVLHVVANAWPSQINSAIPLVTTPFFTDVAGSLIIASVVGITYEWYLEPTRRERILESARAAANDAIEEFESDSIDTVEDQVVETKSVVEDVEAAFENVERTLNAIQTSMERPSPLTILKAGAEDVLDNYLKPEITERGADRVYMLEYSGQNARGTLTAAIHAEATVYLLLKHPSAAEELNFRQKHRVLRSIQDIYEDHGRYDDLHIRFYESPAALRARRIDNRVISLGWYTSDVRQGREHEIWGHNNISFILKNEEMDDFREVAEWFRDVFWRLWDEETTDTEYLSSTDHLEEWIEEDEREKRDWLQAVVDKETDRETMFPDG